jgi:hypothetical protein
MSNSATNTSTRDVVFNTVSIINSVTEIPKELTGLWNTINIYENIFNHVVTGTIELKDGINVHAELGLHGQEYLRISFNKPGENEKLTKYDRAFRIYKVSEKRPTESLIQSYVIHFCSEELIFSNQITLSKSLKGKVISDYVYSICTENLKISNRKIDLLNNFEWSVGVQDFIIPSLSPLNAIRLLTKSAFSGSLSPFMFFENNQGWNFLSLEAMFGKQPLTTLNYSNAKITEDISTAAFKNANQISKMNFKHSFDMLRNTQNLTYSGRLYTLDILRQRYEKNDFSVKNLSATNFIDGKNIPINEARNRNEKNLTEEYNSKIFYSMTNKGQTNAPYLSARNFKVTDTNVESSLMQRESLLNLLNNTILHCTVPGNTLFTVGSIVEIEMPSFAANKPNMRNIDPYLSGKYLITTVRHVLVPSGGHQTLLTVNKNSLSSQLDLADPTLSNYRRMRNL